MPSCNSDRRPDWAAWLGRTVLLGLAAGTAAGLACSLFPPRYRSEAVLLPLPRQEGRLPGLASQLLSRLPAIEQTPEETDREVILGATFVGPDVDDLLQAATIAVVGEVPISRLWHAVPAYPTVSEVWLRLLEAHGRQSA